MGPFKFETLFDANEIGLIHDFASKGECQHVIKHSLQYLKPTPYIVVGKMLNVSHKRTSKSVMYTGEEDILLQGLDKRIGLVTRMKTHENHINEGEKIQVLFNHFR